MSTNGVFMSIEVKVTSAVSQELRPASGQNKPVQSGILSDEKLHAVFNRVVQASPLASEEEWPKLEINRKSERIRAHCNESGRVSIHGGLIDFMEKVAQTSPGNTTVERRAEDLAAAVFAHEVHHIVENHPALHSRGKVGIRFLQIALAITALIAGSVKSQIFSKIESAIKGHKPVQTFGWIVLFLVSIAALIASLYIGGRVLENAYTQRQEVACDRAAVKYVKKAGFDPNAAIAFHAYIAECIEPKYKYPGNLLCYDHPSSSKRKNLIKEEIAELSLKTELEPLLA